MLIVCLLIALLVIAVVAIKWKIAVLAISHYIITKGYSPPTDEERKASSEYVVRRLFR